MTTLATQSASYFKKQDASKNSVTTPQSLSAWSTANLPKKEPYKYVKRSIGFGGNYVAKPPLAERPSATKFKSYCK